MGRVAKVKISGEELRNVINQLENPNGSVEQGKKKGKKGTESTPIVSPYINRSSLYKAVIASEWGLKMAGLGAKMTPANVNNWVTKFSIPLLTPVGKKGRQKGQKIEGGGRKKKGINEEFYNRQISDLERHGDRANTKANRKLAHLAASGNRSAAIKLKCKECNGYEVGVNELIRTCNSTACPLWGLRPYQEVVQIAPLAVTTPETIVEPTKDESVAA